MPYIMLCSYISGVCNLYTVRQQLKTVYVLIHT